MDIKTAPSRYAEVICPAFSKYHGNAEHFEHVLKRSATLVASYPPEQREWRTVLVPPPVQKSDIEAMATILPKDASWQVAQFMNQNCIDPSYNEIYPYTDQEAQELIQYAKTFIKNLCLLTKTFSLYRIPPNHIKINELYLYRSRNKGCVFH